MKKRLVFLHILFCFGYYSFSQSAGIGSATYDPSATLNISAASKELYIPGMGTSEIFNLTRPARGLIVYDTDVNQLKINIGIPIAPNWQIFKPGTTIAELWGLTGNDLTDSGKELILPSNNEPLRFRPINNLAGD